MLDSLDPRAAGARRLAGKVCVVTGAGQGIGKAAAKRLGAEGGSIVVAERIEETALRTLKELQDAGCPAIAAVHDVSQTAGARAAMAAAKDKFGRLDVVVNAVGGTIWWQPFHLYSEEQIHLEFQRSLFATVWCCHAALQHMVEQKSGSIVNVSSRITTGGLYRVPYGVSKGGVDALTRTLAAEYGRHNIRVNAVGTGRTTIQDRATPRELIRPGVMAQPVPHQDEYYQETRGYNPPPLGRASAPPEQASAIAFLASDDASYVTGEILNCSGGN